MNFFWLSGSLAMQRTGFSWHWFVGPQSEWFWVFVQVLVVAASACFIVSQVRSQRLTNMIEALRDVDSKWTSRELLVTRNMVCNKFLETQKLDVDGFTKVDNIILDFFEDLGVFVRFKALSEEVVWEGYSTVIENYWLIFRRSVYRLRQSTGDQNSFTQFETLFSKSRKMSKRKDGAASESLEGLLEFAERDSGWASALLNLKYSG